MNASNDPLPPTSRGSAGPGRSAELLGLLGLLALGVALRFRVLWARGPDGLYDDGYTTLRYAENVAAGLGYVFNAGARVYGSTTPLFTFYLAAWARLLGAEALPWVAAVSGIVFSIGSLAIGARALRVAGAPAPVRWLFLALGATYPSFVDNAASGMETPLLLLLFSVALLCHLERRWVPLGLTFGALFLCRIDAVLFIAPFGAGACWELRRQPRRLWLPVGLFVAIAGGWSLFAQLYFGSAIPQSLKGKAASHAALGAFGVADLERLVPMLLPGARLWGAGLAVLLVLLAIAVRGTIAIVRSAPRLLPLAVFWLASALAFLLGRAPPFSWYFVPGHLALIVLLSFGLHGFARELLGAGRQHVRLLGLIGLLLAIAGASRAVALSARSPRGEPWRTVAAALSAGTTPRASVFLEHIGLIGFLTRRPIYDQMGLVSPEVHSLRLHYGPSFVIESLRRFEPDVVVLYRGPPGSLGLGEDEPELFRSYVPWFDFPCVGPKTGTVFVRGDSENVLRPRADPCGG